MAEESIDLPVAPEVMNSSSVKLRRNSMSKASSGNIEDVVVPHYRRASIGSCHDFCKHGGKQAFEVKGKHSVASRIQISSLSKISEADINGVKAHVANRRASTGSKPPRKASMAKLRESVNSRPQISNIGEKEMATKLADSTKQGGSEVPVTKKKTSVVKLKTIRKKSNTADLPKIVRQGNSSISAKVAGTSLKPTPKVAGTSSKPALVLVRDSSESIMDPVGTSSISIEKMVGSSSKSCEECAEAASKPTAEPVEALSKSITKKEDASSKSTVKKAGALSRSTPKKLEASPKLPTKKVEASPKSTTPKGRASSKSTAQKAETSSKSSAKKLETTSKSTAKKKITAKKVETTPKLADKEEEMSMKSTAKKVVTSTKSTTEVAISSKSVVKKVVISPKSTVKNVEASSTSNSMVRTSSKPTPLKSKLMKSSGKHVAPLKSNSFTVNSISSMNSSEGSNGQSNSKLKMEKRAASLKVAARKLMTPSRASLPSKSSLNNNGVVSTNARKYKSRKIASHLKNQLKTRKCEHKEPGNDAVEEKTLYVIKVESGNKSFQTDRDVEFSPQSSSLAKFSSSSQEGRAESECTTSEGKEDSSSVNLEGELMKNGEALEVKDIRDPRRVGIVSSEDKTSQMPTLNIRRGNLVKLQSETTTPRRLKFRRATGFGENPMVKVEGLRRSFKRRHESGTDRVCSPTGPEKVLLRRQGTHGKRDGHGLFNNVIEETANKLAEIRKSKVKALVGAFETIISLQEIKPAVKVIS
ncbi:hypothetical protein QN277_020562 [Acacia crassicarpa]|uniref:Calmodulin-binding domain-containing protein n=1 Tax=Acacia crassicarpa TaxID=499986 RepID=A0AAE1MSR3_9FABA|nr:hypothetical protein QN277_020562 [Acacia crassicarpa]